MKIRLTLLITLAVGTIGVSHQAGAAVPEQEAAQLKSTLTPLGAEKAGNKDGTIPAWTGGYTTAIPGFKNGGRRGDPFAAEKPLYSITAKNMAEYADKLTDGTKALLKKYPNYRIDVYPTHRTAAAPQWVYDNTAKNATRVKLGATMIPEGAYGGIPFPIPKSGAEAMWNHLLRWRGESWRLDIHGYLGTADGRSVFTLDAVGDQAMPYYYKDGSPEKFQGDFWLLRLINAGPPIRVGEALTARENLSADNTQTWIYLPGQRRVRKLPNGCCDTPTPATAGVMSVDEVEVFTGRLDRFDWKLVGKKEMYIPYNSNKLFQPTKDSEVLDKNFLNPDHVRWELHRVWVVEANIVPGKRHVSPKSRYYLDEDTWSAVLGDRWDANGQLAKTLYQIPIVMPDLPGTVPVTFGFFDHLSNAMFVSNLVNEKSEQYKIMPRYSDTVFTPNAMSGQGLR